MRMPEGRLGNSQPGLLPARAHGGRDAAPRWALLLPVLFVAHLCEEFWGGPGFSAWARATLGAEVSPSRFLGINTVGLLLFTAGVIGAVRSRHLAWIAAAVSSLFLLNGVLHLLATVAFAAYSPGTITGALLYVPLGGLALLSMKRSLPGPVFGRAVLAGIAVHALATFAAFS